MLSAVVGMLCCLCELRTNNFFIYNYVGESNTNKGRILHDDFPSVGSAANKQGFIQLSTDPIITRDFFDNLASNLGVSVTTLKPQTECKELYLTCLEVF